MAIALYLAGIAGKLPHDDATAGVSGVLVLTTLFTVASVLWTDARRRPRGSTFLYVQVFFDLILVTAAVHFTWDGTQADAAPLYILVIAVAALLLRPSGVPLVAALASVLYFADAFIGHGTRPAASLFVQLGLFGLVALLSGLVAARLREAGSEGEQLAAQLAEIRIRESDVERLSARAERLEAIAEMSASLAHEIRNPLASIRSAAEQLGRMRGSEDDRVLSELVQREADRLSRLLTQFLDFARTGVTRIDIVDVVGIARNAVRLAVSQAGNGGEVAVRVTERFPQTALHVEGDEDLLHRAIFNLLLNALQASAGGGEVRIELGELNPSQLPEGAQGFERGAIAVLVSDRGPGIAPEIRDRLFDPFVTTKAGGTGLGLSIVQRAAQAHGGLVMVSPPGEETTFTLVLPKSR